MILLMAAINVVAGTIADLLCSAGMKRHGEFNDWSLQGAMRLCLDVLGNPFILASIPAMAISFFALIVLLSVAPLSFAVPVTASSYVLESALAKYILKEEVHWERWTGVALVTVGIALLAA